MVSKTALRRSPPSGALPDFAPVPRKSPRHDGWTPERQRAFIAALADTGCVAIAARMVNMSQPSYYQLRRQPGAEGFRKAWDAAQNLGLQIVKDEAFDRAMNGQLMPVFVGGKLMGFRRKKNDRLLMFILRHYGQDTGGRKTTVNYFSTRATAGAAAQKSSPAFAGEGDHPQGGGGALAAAEASTTTVKTVITGSGPPQSQLAADEAAASILNAFEGAELDPQAQAEIRRTLESCAERRRALENDPENDPDRVFIGEAETNLYLGELEIGVEGDGVEFRPDGEHYWESLGEGGEAEKIDEVLAGMAERRAAKTPEQLEAAPEPDPPVLSEVESETTEGQRDDPSLDWRNWSDAGYEPPSDPPPDSRGRGTAGTVVEGLSLDEEPAPAQAGEGLISPRTGRPLKRYKKRTPKPAFTAPDEARKAEAGAEVEAVRREGAAAAAERRRRRSSNLPSTGSEL